MGGRGSSFLTQRLVLLCVLPITLFVAFSAWAFASPIGSNPDDDFHLANLYCIPHQAKCDEAPTVRLPACDHTAVRGEDCERAANRRKPPLAGSNLTYYPSQRYWALSHLRGETVGETSIRIRLFNAGLGSLAVWAAILLSDGRRWRATALAWLVLVVPLGMILIPSTNPSGWLYMGVGCMIGPLVSFLSERGPPGLRSLGQVVFVLLMALSALASRNEAPVYVAAASVTAVMLADWRYMAWRVLVPASVIFLTLWGYLDRLSRAGIDPSAEALPGRSWQSLLSSLSGPILLAAGAGIALLVLIALIPRRSWRLVSLGVVLTTAALFILMNYGERLRSALSQTTPGTYDPLHNLLMSWKIPASAIGYPLQVPGLPAMMSKPLPTAALVASFAGLLILLALGVRDNDVRKLRALPVVLAVAIAFPLMDAHSRQLSIDDPAIFTLFQARYFASGSFLFVFVLLVQTRDRPFGPRLVVLTATGLTAVANAGVFAYYILDWTNQFVPGPGALSALVDADQPAWWWLDQVSPFGLWLVGSAAFVVFAAAVTILVSAEWQPTEDHAPEQPDDPYDEFWNPPEDRPARVQLPG